MEVTCTNEKCLHEITVNEAILESEGNSSGNHTTQYSLTGTIDCPICKNTMEISYLSDESDDTGEILTTDLISLS